MRGVLRYRPEDVVAILDSTRAGETHDGPARSSAASTTRSASTRPPRSSASRPRAAASRPPGASCSQSCIAKGSTSRTACTSSSPTTPSCRARRPSRRRAARPAPAAGRARRADRREPRRARATIVLTVGSDCAIGKMTVALELDLEARRRGVALACSSRPARPGSRSPAGASRSTRSSPTSSPAPPSGSSSRAPSAGASCSGSRGRASLLHPVVLGRHARARPRQRAARVRALPQGRAGRRSRAPAAAAPDPAAAELVELHERIALLARPARVVARRAEHAAGSTRRGRGPRSRRPSAETGLPADDPVRFGAGPTRRRRVSAVGGRRAEDGERKSPKGCLRWRPGRFDYRGTTRGHSGQERGKT